MTPAERGGIAFWVQPQVQWLDNLTLPRLGYRLALEYIKTGLDEHKRGKPPDNQVIQQSLQLDEEISARLIQRLCQRRHPSDGVSAMLKAEFQFEVTKDSVVLGQQQGESRILCTYYHGKGSGQTNPIPLTVCDDCGASSAMLYHILEGSPEDQCPN